MQSYGYNDLAGQLRSALDLPRDVHLVPFFVVALLVVVYILLIGPGDYFLLRRLGCGMQWTWVTFPAIVVLFAAGAYVAAYWLKGDQLRVSQADLVDIDAEGTARGASWFSIFSPRGESFDVSMQPRLPDGQPPQEASVSLAWLGKAGNEFNGMYSRDTQDTVPLWSPRYSIASSLGAIHDVPIQVWASKSFTQRWLGRAPDPGLDAALKDDQRQLSGTIANRLKGNEPQRKDGIALSHCFLAYDGWAYVIGELRPGESVEIGPATRRISLNTFISGELSYFAEGPGEKPEKGPYDASSRDMAYVLQAMMFYDAADGRKWTEHGQRLPGIHGPQRSAQGRSRGPGGHAAAGRLLPRRRLAPRTGAEARRTRRPPPLGQCPGPAHDHLSFHPPRCTGRRRQLTNSFHP